MTSMVTGEIEKSEELVLQWRIPDFFSIPAEVDQEVYSSSFNFADAKWTLGMYPNGSKEFDTEGYIDLYLKRLSPGPDIELELSLHLKTSNNTIDKEERFANIFDAELLYYGWPFFLKRSEILEKRSVFAPSGHLTVVCRLKHVKSIDAASDNRSSGCTVKSKILEDLKQLLLSQENCDVMIRVKGQEFPAHKNILTVRSPVFAAAFRIEMREKETSAIDIEDLDPDTFPNFLQYLYCEDLEKLSADNVFNLFTAADKYEVMDLRTKCLEFMTKNLSVDTFCDTMTIAMRHAETELIRLATDFFLANADKIIVNVEWQSFVAQNPTQSNELFMKFVASVKR